MGLLKKIDEVFATARYYEALSQKLARDGRLDHAPAATTMATAPESEERHPIAA